MSSMQAGLARARHTILGVLPEGRELPEDEWSARHRAILIVVFAHAIGVALFGLYMGIAAPLAIGEGLLIAAIGGVAAIQSAKRRFRGAVAALALVFSSAAIVQFSGGYIEAHFHFFVMLAVISLYQDWIPFLLAIVYVAVDHGVVGALFPEAVYNHPAAFAHPWRWALIHASLVLGESAALLMGWKVAEQARRRTALVLDSAGEGILGLDLAGRVTFANPAAATMTQRTVGELLGVDVATLLRAGVEPIASIAGSDVRPAELIARKDGTLVPVECERTPILNNEAIIGTVLTLKDITERQRSEDALRRAVSTLTATLESTTDGILVIDPQGKIAGFNKRFVELWGIPMGIMSRGDDEAALAYVQQQLVDPDGFRQKVRDLYAAPEATSFDVLEFSDGRTFERYSQPQRSGDDVIGRVWSFRDVTQRRANERALREQVELHATNERLREMDRMRTQFINNAAHELGTPLTPIKLQAHMLKTEKLGPLSERQRSSVAVLSRNVDHLGTLLGDVIDSARVQSGRLELRRQDTDIFRVAEQAVESFLEAANQQGVTITLNGDRAVVPVDESRITQVLFNLVRNALKFTERGGCIDVRLAARDAGVLVEVSDTGCGIAPDDIPKLFQAFSQVHDKMQKTRSGTGLGLYVAKGIIESHGGTIACESAGPGRGTTFRFLLPFGEGGPPPGAQERA